MPDSPSAGRQEVLDYIEMARKTGVPYIRVMVLSRFLLPAPAGKGPYSSSSEAEEELPSSF